MRYRIKALVQPESFWSDQPADYIVRSEQFGVPQRRHRVILLGLREDIEDKLGALSPRRPATVGQALEGLPRLRSGISRAQDSGELWISALRSMKKDDWIKQLDPEVRLAVVEAIKSAKPPRLGRGSDVLQSHGSMILNHSSRAHILDDLRRYLFCAAFGQAKADSPRIRDFPDDLLPDHKNVGLAIDEGLFGDRFRVQLRNQPSTTITSHISKDGHYYIHPDPCQCRSLTVREAARLQTFPDDYFFCGPRTAQYQQVGNAVPPALARQIAAVVANALG